MICKTVGVIVHFIAITVYGIYKINYECIILFRKHVESDNELLNKHVSPWEVLRT